MQTDKHALLYYYQHLEKKELSKKSQKTPQI